MILRGTWGAQAHPIEERVMEDLEETLKYIFVLLNQVFITL